MKIGVDYYPEHWEKSIWREDVEKMRAAGVKIVRMAEFAWSRLEPQEGVYCWEWLDEMIALFAACRISVFLCTPTATPPQWLFEKYPEVIQIGNDGKKVPLGIRGHRCLNSPVYREKCAKIITEMVLHYRGNKTVIGYQIDNELEANRCCCQVCAEKFRTFVREKYGTIDAVNAAYGNVVWSGEYSDFSQIMPPQGQHQTWLNPSYMLDFSRYASQSTVDYVEFQQKLIRSLDADALLTTNSWLCENMPDFYRMFRKLDFVSYDNYPPTVIPDDEEAIYSHAFHLDLMRGIRQENFWVMEQLSGGMGGWAPMTPTLQPGMLKGYSLQAIAHGADTVLHFRWRTAASGAEMFWHGILDHSNKPGRRYQEFCELCGTVNSWKNMEGSVIENKVALLYSSEQEYAFKIQPQVEGMHYFTQLKLYHDAFTALGIGVDIIDWLSDLKPYDIVIAPTLFVTNAEIVKNMEKFVKRGGYLVLTNRSGVKNSDNCCVMSPLPTVFSELAGVTVEEYDPIGLRKQKLRKTSAFKELFCGETKQNVFLSENISERVMTGSLWCDILEEGKTKVLVRYDENFYKGRAAITENLYGSGKTCYVGTVLDRCGTHALARHIIKETGLAYVSGLPVGVERTVRQKAGCQWTFLFNNTQKEQNFSWKLEAAEDTGKLRRETLQPFEMKVIETSY